LDAIPGAEVFTEKNFTHHRCGTGKNTSQCITVSTYIFGGCLHADVYTKLNGLLVKRCTETVVNNRNDTPGSGKIGNLSQVLYIQPPRIGRL
jgi:hypothetical protein